MNCVECNKPISLPTSNPFRCPTCRALRRNDWRLVCIDNATPGGHGSWVETNHPAVVACMGSVPECAENGCQARIIRKEAAADPALRTLSQQWRKEAKELTASANPLAWQQVIDTLDQCAADLDRLCPEIRDEPKPTTDPV